MRNFQQKLFVILALALCGLCAYQWYFQTVQRKALERLDQIVYQKATDIQGYTNSMKSMDAEIAQAQDRINQLKMEAMTNSQDLIMQRREVARLLSANDIMSNEIVQYKTGVTKLQDDLKEAYDGIKKQNAAIKEAVAQRDEFVQKFNDSVKARNTLADQYNALVDRINKLQTNAAAK